MDVEKKEVLFEVIFMPTKEITKEFQNRLNLKAHTIFAYAFGVIVLLFGLWSGWLGSTGLFWVCVILAPVCPVVIEYRKQSEAKQILNLWAAGPVGTAGYKAEFFDEIFTHRDLSFRYDQISTFTKGNLCLYIQIKKTITIIAKKDSFTKGDYESFVSFLREKLKDNPKALRGLK